jgi:Protein of unknown function (DUF3237)
MREFTPPKVTTRDRIGVVGLDFAFQIEARFDEPHEFRTLRGGRVYQSIIGGIVSGPKLQGKVYPDSGGDYDFRRPDGIADVNARFMLNASDGEWIYISHSGYHRADGYYRVMAFCDAEADGPHAWLNDSVLIATAQESADRRSVTFTYYEAV